MLANPHFPITNQLLYQLSYAGKSTRYGSAPRLCDKSVTPIGVA
jgi:hypothetical protein